MRLASSFCGLMFLVVRVTILAATSLLMGRSFRVWCDIVEKEAIEDLEQRNSGKLREIICNH
jgi:hypothetical protein